jgi:hypothetical protein
MKTLLYVVYVLLISFALYSCDNVRNTCFHTYTKWGPPQVGGALCNYQLRTCTKCGIIQRNDISDIW